MNLWRQGDFNPTRAGSNIASVVDSRREGVAAGTSHLHGAEAGEGEDGARKVQLRALSTGAGEDVCCHVMDPGSIVDPEVVGTESLGPAGHSALELLWCHKLGQPLVISMGQAAHIQSNFLSVATKE